MKSITYFYLKGSPECKNADEILAQLLKENPEYSRLEIHYIDENTNPEYCDLMDYLYVPCFYVDGINRHEGKVTKETVRQILELAME
ncbi:MAG: thioredoxin family protein [Oscillospiraceae bacterium]|nr:thioredoxin family protein [Oscillospiraceae bacterium]